jgi:hypothetical protein
VTPLPPQSCSVRWAPRLLLRHPHKCAMAKKLPSDAGGKCMQVTSGPRSTDVQDYEVLTLFTRVRPAD